MRTLALVLVLLSRQAAKDDEVDRLVKRLEDDSIEAREAAFKDLVALGPKVLDALRARAASAEGDFRTRLRDVVGEIERLERVKPFLGSASRITLALEKKPLREAVAELAKRSPMKIAVDDKSPDTPVTLHLKDAALFEALDRLCRAHGGVILRPPYGSVAKGEDLGVLQLVAGDPAASRRCCEGPYFVQLSAIRLWEKSDFRGKIDPSMEMVIQYGWEPGVRPIGVRLRVTSIVDEAGTAYKATGGRENEWDGAVNRHTQISLDPGPPAPVKSFKEIAGVLELRFPSDAFEARLGRPVGKQDVKAEGGAASFTLRECVRDNEDYRVKLETGFSKEEYFLQRPRFHLIDKAGRAYSPGRSRGSGTGPGRMEYTLKVPVPADAEIVELRCEKILSEKGRTLERAIPWRFENVRFR